VARRLIDARRANGNATGGAARAGAEACGKLYVDLSRWVGSDGCHALFTRALTEVRARHPALAQIHLRVRSDPYVDGVAETTAAHGEAAAAQALEAMLAFLIELLGRLIGEDMAMKLIQRSVPVSSESTKITDPPKEKA
jgi:hypothetical protein